jgi:hypothetical protein
LGLKIVILFNIQLSRAILVIKEILMPLVP